MPVENIPVELIDDNPFNPRTYFPTKKIAELAESIERVGLRETPQGRQVDGRYQLAFGSLRKRAYLKLNKKSPERWPTMPVDVQSISDDDMFVIAVEENLKRTDLKPIEVARGIDAFLNKKPDISEVKLAAALGMTQGAVSNMRRVIALPPEILEKVDEEIINFHMARELLVLLGLTDAVELMREAISKLKTGSKSYGHPSTVQGIITAIAEVASNHFKPLEKNVSWRGNAPLFDTKEAGCFSCEKMIAVHPTQKETSHYCTSKECWEKKQQEHRVKVSTGVKAKMETEVLERAATEVEKPISQEIPQPIKLSGKAGDVIHALHTGKPVEISKLIEAVLPPSGVRWAEDVPREECHNCNLDTEDHTVDLSFPEPDRAASDGVAYRKVCLKDYRAVIEKQPAEIEEVKQTIPADILTLAREKAGTRAEVLDIHEMMPPTHTILKRKYGGIIDELDSPDECVERCTTGFHYAYDSADNDETQVCYVCTNPKCLAQKKGAKTRAEHAEGLGKKQAETKAIKAALKLIEVFPDVSIEVTEKVTRATLKLIILAQLEGKHLANYCGNWKKPSKWIWDEVSSGTAEDKRSEEALWKTLDKMSEPELTVLVVKMMFYYLTDAGSDIGRYEIKTAEPLQWFGIDVKQYLKSKEV